MVPNSHALGRPSGEVLPAARPVELPKSLERIVSSGHPWVYRDHLPSGLTLPHGSFVEVKAGSSRAFALYDAESPIALRIYSTQGRPDDRFIAARVREAFEARAEIRESGTTAYRWIFGEGDQLPGICVDLYGKFAVMTCYASSVEVLVEPVKQALLSTAELHGVLSRVKLPEAGHRLEVLSGRKPPERLIVEEYGVRLVAELERGQKTGLFLDQRDNRRFMAERCRGKRVLNLFAYTGGFSLRAALGGAEHVTSVDISDGALDAARENFRINGLDPTEHDFVVADVFKFLTTAISQKKKYDVVICDPPSFAKRREQKERALKSYRQLNADGLRVLELGGLYAASSCTSQVSPLEFNQTLAESARRAKRRFQILHEAGQPLDHPVLAQHPEGRYLKFVLGRVLSVF